MPSILGLSILEKYEKDVAKWGFIRKGIKVLGLEIGRLPNTMVGISLGGFLRRIQHLYLLLPIHLEDHLHHR